MSELDPAQLFAPVLGEKTMGLAVSGGADSLALMLLYAAWSDPRKPTAIVYTLDHGLRPEARGEAEMVVREAARLGLETRLLTWSGPKPATGKQAAARAARYRLIAEAMRADGVNVLLTAHHRRDQAETVLMRLAHGSGITGLGGMRDFSDIEGVRVFRPLLDLPPETLAEYVAQTGLTPATDPSNTDRTYERTRWREALPELAGLGLTEDRIAATARRLQRVDALAERLANAFSAAHLQLDALGVIRLSRSTFAQADPEIAIRVLGQALAAASGGKGCPLARLEALAERIAGGTTFAATLSGAQIEAGADQLVFYREAGRAGLGTFKLPARETALWDGRFLVAAATPLSVAPASSMTRERFADLTGTPLAGPVAALRAAPIICDEVGSVLALGALHLKPGVTVTQPALTAWRSNCGKRPPSGPAALVSPE